MDGMPVRLPEFVAIAAVALSDVVKRLPIIAGFDAIHPHYLAVIQARWGIF